MPRGVIPVLLGKDLVKRQVDLSEMLKKKKLVIFSRRTCV